MNKRSKKQKRSADAARWAPPSAMPTVGVPAGDRTTRQDDDVSLTPVFAFPFYRAQLAECAAMNAELTALILADEAASPGISRSNIGGWHSDESFFERPNAAVAKLRAYANAALKTVLANVTSYGEVDRIGVGFAAWANVMRRGGYNNVHNHGDADWSGVYYVDPGDPPSQRHPHSGIFEFIDPRGGVERLRLSGDDFAPMWRIEPKAGLLILFPGGMRHAVHPYQGNAPRISIAFNIRVEAA